MKPRTKYEADVNSIAPFSHCPSSLDFKANLNALLLAMAMDGTQLPREEFVDSRMSLSFGSQAVCPLIVDALTLIAAAWHVAI